MAGAPENAGVVNGMSCNGSTWSGVINFQSSDNVGIGTASPAAALDVVGDIHYSGSLADVSDRRAKLAIQVLPAGQLHRIMQLAPVSFIMKNDPKQRTELGLIAQDVEPLYPNLVQTDSTGMKSMNYVSLISPIIAAMQEQQYEIRALWAAVIVSVCAAFAACSVLWRVRHRLTAL